MKKFFVLATLLLSVSSLSFGAISFRFDPTSIGAGNLRTTIEANVSNLLTEIDNAGREGRDLNLLSVKIEANARERLMALWSDIRFVVEAAPGTPIVQKCINDFQGYQVRSIPITIRPYDDSYTESLDRELTVSIDKRGVITGVRPAMESQQDINSILRNATIVDDFARRMEILKWVEDFRCYYNERNINALEAIFSDDALIITGSVVTRQKRRKGDGPTAMQTSIRYEQKTKAQYIASMRRIFRPGYNKHINIEFENISVEQHSTKPNIYFVQLRQKWNTTRYSDDGYLSLVWDFNDPEHPQIHVRVWQPNAVAEMDGVFELDDVFFP